MGKAVLMLYTWPLFLTVLSVCWLKEKITKYQILFLFMSFVGVLLIFLSRGSKIDKTEYLGLICMLGVAVLNAVVVTIFKDQLKNRDPYEVIMYDNVIGSVAGIPYLASVIPFTSTLTLVHAFTYGLFIGFIGFLFFYRGLTALQASIVSVLSYTEVFIASLLGVLFMSDSVTVGFVIGGALILLAAWGVRHFDLTKVTL